MEIWKDIPEYEGHYQVSDQGRVKSLARVLPHKRVGTQKLKEKILKPSKNNDGYNTVGLSLNGNKKTVKNHQLVAITFLGHKPNDDGLIVDHKYPPKTDNRLSNLQLITRRENSSKDQWRHNRSSEYIGVYWDKERKKWVAQITINKKNKYLGRFNTELEASEAYQNKLKEIKNPPHG